MPAPSPMTNPSRSTSKGRERSWPLSAVMLRKPASAMSTMTASAPPATATGQRPWATRRAALPIAWVPAAHAVVTVSHGPPRPKRMDTAAVAALGIIMGTMKGDTRSGPFSNRTRYCSRTVCRPPMPVVTMLPASTRGPSSPLWRHASSAAISA